MPHLLANLISIRTLYRSQNFKYYICSALQVLQAMTQKTSYEIQLIRSMIKMVISSNMTTSSNDLDEIP